MINWFAETNGNEDGRYTRLHNCMARLKQSLEKRLKDAQDKECAKGVQDKGYVKGVQAKGDAPIKVEDAVGELGGV
jgi:hypothetical protein